MKKHHSKQSVNLQEGSISQQTQNDEQIAKALQVSLKFSKGRYIVLFPTVVIQLRC